MLPITAAGLAVELLPLVLTPPPPAPPTPTPPAPSALWPTVSAPAVAGNQAVLTQFNPRLGPTLAWARGLLVSASSSEEKSHNGSSSQGCRRDEVG